MSVPDLEERLAPALDAARQHAEEIDRQARFPRDTIDALGASGLLGLTVDARLGGLGAGQREAYAVVEAIARHCPSSGMVLTMHYAATAVLHAGGRFDEVLRRIADGVHLSTLALSERATRSNFWISMGCAERVGGGTRIEVEKSFVTSAGPANSYVVSVATPGRSRVDESELWLVEADRDGVEVLDWWQGSGLRGNSSGPMRFHCVLPPEAAVSAPAEGLSLILGHVLPWFHLGAAAVSVGIARGAAALAGEHVADTVLEHLGQRLMDQPVVRHTLGRLVAQADTIDGFARSVAAELAEGTAQPERVFALKAMANEAALTCTDLAMRLGGGAAYAGRNGMDRLFRDARAGVVMAPTADMLFEMIGRVSCGLPPLDTGQL
jgi:alkylation response protein AidB-like acyl-CoA dehydrogenase